MTATTARPLGPRTLPVPPEQSYQAYESAWYEAEERLAPSYVLPQASGPPPSPSAKLGKDGPSVADRSSGATSTGDFWPQSPSPSPRQMSWLPAGAAMPYHFYENRSSMHGAAAAASRPFPSRLKPNEGMALKSDAPRTYQSRAYVQPRQVSSRLQSFTAPDGQHSPGQSGRTFRNGKGSAFMHKGFFDILQLVNDRDNPSAAKFLAPPPTGGDVQTNPSKFLTTLGRAAGALRKSSAPARAAEEPLDYAISCPRQSAPAQPKRSSASPLRMNSAQQSYAPLPQNLAGPRAAKKRISVDMVSAPRPSSFVHAVHASDAEQAEAILDRWGRDGVGKVADPTWVEPIKEALKLQAARNQAEAIAQIQAALHQDLAFHDQHRNYHITNGLPSSMSSSALTGTTSITGDATVGHTSGTILPPSPSPLPTPETPAAWTNRFHDIVEEGRAGSDDVPTGLSAETVFPEQPSTPHGPKTQSPPGYHLSSLRTSAAGYSTMMSRPNTAGTTFINPTPSPDSRAQAEASDYIAYKAVPESTQQPICESIDGLPGSVGNLTTMFESRSAAVTRPTSMVVRDLGNAMNSVALNPAELYAPISFQDTSTWLRPSLTTVEKSVAAKIYFENLYYGILKKPAARETRRAGLEKELASLRISEASKEAIRQAWISRETEHLRQVRDRVSANSFVKLKTIGHGAFGIVALVKDKENGELFAMKQLRKADMLRKGQEGHVRAERDLMTSASASGSRRWIVNLVYSFQDVDHLYLIMEFMGGGDLLNLLIERDIFAEDFARFYVAEMILAIHEAHRLGYIHRDIKPDNFLFTSEGHIKLADFGLCQSFHWAHDGAYYDRQRRNLLRTHGIDLEDAGGRRGRGVISSNTRTREMRGERVEAGLQLDKQQLGEIMSDRNPDGTPLTHVLSWRDKNKKKIAYSVVGTNNYMAPEVLRGLGYDQSCDWWSLGVIVFEMLYGYPPFVSKSRHLTRQKILNWRQTLRFPSKPRVSREAQDFVARLVCEQDDRLGSRTSASVNRPNSLLQGARQQSGFAPNANAGVPAPDGLADGVEDLMSHSWFKGIDWVELHRQRAPFSPDLSHPADTKYFEDDIEDEPLAASAAGPVENGGVALSPDSARDPMLRDKAHGPRLLEMRKQLAFLGYTFKRPPAFDPREIHEADVSAAEHATEEAARRLGMTIGGAAGTHHPSHGSMGEKGSRMRSMSM